MKVTILPPAYQGDPEALAMLQAFYSRSTEPIEDRINRLGGDLTQVKKSLHNYYIGYGHRSIAQCATVTVFVEGVSLLAAKYLQDSPLYNGQECSTRYIDLGNNTYRGLGDRWIPLFKKVLAALQQEAPARLGVKHEDATAMRAVNAWCFDRARSLLPVSLLTNLSVTMTLDAWNTHLYRLLENQHLEVQEIGRELLRALADRFPSAIKPAPTYGRPFFAEKGEVVDGTYYSFHLLTEGRDPEPLKEMLQERMAAGDRSPIDLWAQTSTADTRLYTQGHIDYGSWRELQRHRPSGFKLTEPTSGSGFYEPYLQEMKEMLEPDLYRQVKSVTDEVPSSVYDCPLGTTVVYEADMPVTQAVYLVETRCAQTVHFTLRPHAQALARYLHRNGYPTHSDMSQTVFTSRRGQQTITEK